MRQEPGGTGVRSCLLATIWASSTLVLTWHVGSDVAGGDSGEIGGAAFSLGVAHPTGFALDMLLLRSFALLPLGSIAWRENLGVACISACVVTSLAWLAWWIAEQQGLGRLPSAAGAGLSACTLLAFHTFVASALAVEVYSTALLLLACAAIVTLPAQRSHRATLWLLFGLALGAHVTAGWLMLPLVAGDLLATRPEPPVWKRWLTTRFTLFACGAIVIAYLPLASARNTAFDWGDPQTLGRFWRHLSAARIRDAYVHDMFRAQAGAGRLLFAQLTEQPWLYVPATLGAAYLWRTRRAVVLLMLATLSSDLAYAVWVNPMGIAERQLGHTSGALVALFAGVGGAWSCQWLGGRARWLGRSALVGVAALSAFVLMRSVWLDASDGYALAERYGSGSPLLDLAPRAVYLCSTDSACASALFAVYAEGMRPDIAVVPAQHLWDPVVVRRLSGVLPQPPSAAPAAAAAKSTLATRVLQTLVRRSAVRPLSFESWPGPSVGQAASAFDLQHVPWLGLAAAGPFAVSSAVRARDVAHAAHATRAAADSALAELAALETARFGGSGPHTRLARQLWASARAELGKLYLADGQLSLALSALQSVVKLTPERAVAHSNLGVAFEAADDFAAALRETRRAIESDPARPTAWVNLVRLVLRTSGRAAARSVLMAAERAAVRDPRLQQLRRELASDQGNTAN